MKTDLEELKLLAHYLVRADSNCDCRWCQLTKHLPDIIADLEELKRLESSN